MGVKSEQKGRFGGEEEPHKAYSPGDPTTASLPVSLDGLDGGASWSR